MDVALAHPWGQDVLPSSANTDGAAARRREEIKHKKHSHETLPGYSPSLILLVMEHFGRWGQETSDYLNQLSWLSRNEDGRPNPSDFKTQWRRRLSVQLQRCNARVIARKMASGRQSVQGLDTAQF